MADEEQRSWDMLGKESQKTAKVGQQLTCILYVVTTSVVGSIVGGNVDADVDVDVSFMFGNVPVQIWGHRACQTLCVIPRCSCPA